MTNVMNYESDILYIKGVLVISIILLAVGTIYMIQNRKKYYSYREPIVWISFGLLSLLGSLIYNGLASGCWALENILSLFMLTHFESGCSYPGEVVTRLTILEGYLIVIWGVIFLSIVRKNRKQIQ